MFFLGWRKWLQQTLIVSQRTPQKRKSFQPRVEKLEDRWMPDSTPMIVVSPRPIKAVEGVTDTQIVATFTDSPGHPDEDDFIVTISWGDNTTSSGTVTSHGKTYTITASHTYSEETGSSPKSVSIGIVDTNQNTSASATTSATVTDASLFASFAMGSQVEGQSFSGAVATFTDRSSISGTQDFSAEIYWGDGTSSPGGISSSFGTYTVTGTHTYTEDDAASVSVSITDDGGASATASGTINVAEADLSLTAFPVTTTEQATKYVGPVTNTPASSFLLATFTDTGTNDPSSSFSASINWGDGTSSAGAVSGFTVFGTHTYADEGSFSIQVIVSEPGVANSSVTATTTATVGESDSLSATGVSFTTSEGATGGTSFSISQTIRTQPNDASSFTVATFTDTYTGNKATDFTARIDWGDYTTTDGMVVGASGNFSVLGTHTYADEGSFSVKVTVKDDGAGTATATASSTAVVTESDVLSGSAGPIAAQDHTATSVMATFTDTGYPQNTPSDFAAIIDWGDGNSLDTGSLTQSSNGTFTVTGTHTYSDEGSYSVHVTLKDDAPGTASAVATTTAIIDGLSVTGTPIDTTEGVSFTTQVATFSDPGTDDSTSDFSAIIHWGDGTSSAGSITAGNSSGTFVVTGTHTYTDEFNNPITVTVHEEPSLGVSVSSVTDNSVGEADLLEGDAVDHQIAEGSALHNVVVATFTDTNANATTSDFVATIDWGDGTTTPATVTAGVSGSYNVLATHTYADEGSFSTTVTVKDDDPGTALEVMSGLNYVTEADTLSGVALTTSSGRGNTITATATFSDSGYPGNSATDFYAVIKWGDGKTTTTTAVTKVSGNYRVIASHVYSDSGNYSLSVSLFDDMPGTASAERHTTVSLGHT